MPNNKNKELVESLKQKVKDSKSVVFTEYHGLDANKINELRQMVRDNGGEVSVAKNTLVKIALNENKLDDKNLETDLKGPTAVFFAYNDAVSLIKSLFDFAKKNEDLPAIKAGFFEGMYADVTKLKILSELPSKEQLLGQFVGTLKSPLAGIVNVLGGPQRKFVSVLSNIAKEKEV